MRDVRPLALLVLLAACSGEVAATDAATGVDVGAGTDSGGRDAASATDSGGLDAATTNDAATTSDAATLADAGRDAFVSPVDAATTVDAAEPVDAWTPTGRTVPVGHCGAQSGLYFPESTWIYTDVHAAPVRANSAATTAWLASHGSWGTGALQIDFSFAINDASASSRHVPVAEASGYYDGECDPGASVSFPLPIGGRAEGTADYACGGVSAGDCHVLVTDFSAGRLFESYGSDFTGTSLESLCVITWNLGHDTWGTPPAAGALPDPTTRNWGNGQGCTSTDAAGFPIAPLLVTVGDVMSGQVEHAIRFILPNARMQRAAASGAASPVWVWPASHAGGPTAYDPNAPIYGSRWRLHDPFDYAAHGISSPTPAMQAIVYGLQHYGMVLADGGNIAFTFEGDEGCGTTWADLGVDSHLFQDFLPGDFDVLETGATGSGYDCVRNAAR